MREPRRHTTPRARPHLACATGVPIATRSRATTMIVRLLALAGLLLSHVALAVPKSRFIKDINVDKAEEVRARGRARVRSAARRASRVRGGRRFTPRRAGAVLGSARDADTWHPPAHAQDWKDYEDDEWHEDTFEWKKKIKAARAGNLDVDELAATAKRGGDIKDAYLSHAAKSGDMHMSFVTLKKGVCAAQKCAEELGARWRDLLKTDGLAVGLYPLSETELLYTEEDGRVIEARDFLLQQPEVEKFRWKDTGAWGWGGGGGGWHSPLKPRARKGEDVPRARKGEARAPHAVAPTLAHAHPSPPSPLPPVRPQTSRRRRCSRRRKRPRRPSARRACARSGARPRRRSRPRQPSRRRGAPPRVSCEGGHVAHGRVFNLHRPVTPRDQFESVVSSP